jgi:hypothetical protein
VIWVAFRIVLGMPIGEPLLAAATRKRLREALNKEFPIDP